MLAIRCRHLSNCGGALGEMFGRRAWVANEGKCVNTLFVVHFDVGIGRLCVIVAMPENVQHMGQTSSVKPRALFLRIYRRAYCGK